MYFGDAASDVGEIANITKSNKIARNNFLIMFFSVIMIPDNE